MIGLPCSARRAAVAFAAAALLLAPAAAQDFDERFEEARALTWAQSTRGDGIEALRELVRERPGAFGPRYELAQVLTWKRATRDEGIDRLRALEADYPGNADVEETLARTLSWSTRTRDEAIGRLRRLVERDPARISARLALAEVLSWRSETRPEADRLYRGVLRDDPASVEARVGLARLESWTGNFDAARALYADALAEDPSDADARIGLAQISVWTGRPRAALSLLDGLDERGRADKEAIKAAGEAYEAIGYRTLALDAYGRYVGESPGDAWAERRIERLTDRLRPRLTLGLFASTESGDPGTSKLEWLRLPATWSWFPAGDLEVGVGAQLASFENSAGDTRRASVGATAETPIGRHVAVDGAAWLHDFEEADGEIEAELGLAVTPVDPVTLRLGVRRRPLLSSRLSATGERIGGALYGPAILDEITAGVSVRFARRWHASVSGGSGSVDGTRLAENDRTWVYGEVGRKLALRDADLTAKVLVYQLEHDLDLGGFPPSALGGDGITARGVGGYFSPFRFRNGMLQVDASWSSGDRLDFFASGALGVQQGIDAEDTKFSSLDLSSRALFVVSWRWTERLIVRGIAERQDVADAFDRTRIGGELVILF